MKGSRPRFASPLHVGGPVVADRAAFLRRVEAALDRRWLSNDGPLVREFEERVAEVSGARHCVAAANGTLSLQIAARALGMSGDVIMPAFTFAATPHAFAWIGATPRFCDIVEESHNIDPLSAASCVRPETTGIVGVHLWGEPCDIESMEQLARTLRLPLLVDGAHAFGCTRGDRPIGAFGHPVVFSFHATKFVQAIEGGAIVTDDDGLAEELRSLRRFGVSTDGHTERLGVNARMNEVSAAMGLSSLDGMNDALAANRRNYDAYAAGLRSIPGIRLLEHGEGRRNWQFVVIEVSEAQAGISRDRLMDSLHAHNVLARRYFWPGCHHVEPYASRPDRPDLPVTDAVASRVLVLPTGLAVGAEDVAVVCELIAEATYAHKRTA